MKRRMKNENEKKKMKWKWKEENARIKTNHPMRGDSILDSVIEKNVNLDQPNQPLLPRVDQFDSINQS